MHRIMFVCHGNICRSPMAEFIFKDIVNKHGLANEFSISSCATSTEEIGNPVYPPARAELLKHGITCDGKRAVQLKRQDYELYDMFICMDSNNLRNIYRIFGDDVENKVHKLLDFVSGGDVADPWYYGNFDKTYYEISSGCNALLKKILNE